MSLCTELSIFTLKMRKTLEIKIAGFGSCCGNRAFDAEHVVAYEASEMMRVWLKKGLVDCAIVACEGAGTVITANGRLVQGIGARLTRIISISPIPEVIERVGRRLELFWIRLLHGLTSLKV